MKFHIAVVSFIFAATCTLAAQTPTAPEPLAGLGAADGASPKLFGYLPKQGLDASSLRYFPSATSYEAGEKEVETAYINTSCDVCDMEIAQARYRDGGRDGMLSLMKFPTPELAEEYYDRLAISPSAAGNGRSVYARRTGQLVAVLEGNFNPLSADKLLGTIKFGYSIRWDSGEKKHTGVIWGIPTSILKAVVGSLVFSLIAGACAILIGIAIGVGRFTLRRYKEKRSPKPAEDDAGFTRLNLK
ncbi:MAG: hypothetical protein LBP68_05475 [Acidobacteriota bacterium]|jgi:hypothetical protein|nr:hypothetical protein [Acidobacteriota bacterium]